MFFSEKSLDREYSEVVVYRYTAKKLPLKIFQNSQENTCVRVFIGEVAGALQLS